MTGGHLILLAAGAVCAAVAWLLCVAMHDARAEMEAWGLWSRDDSGARDGDAE